MGKLLMRRSDLQAPGEIVGWLLVLCMLLTFVYPATSFWHVFVHTVPKLFVSNGANRLLLLSFYSVLFVGIAVFSFVAGLRLWLIKPDAVKIAKRFLIAYLCGNIGYFLFWLLLTRPTQVASLSEMGWYHLVGPLPSTFLWYSYLEHSKRVRVTYPTD